MKQVQLDIEEQLHDDDCQLNYPQLPCICDCSITKHTSQEIKEFEEYCDEHDTIWGPDE